MAQRQNRGCCKTDVTETEPDVNQHQADRYDHGDNGMRSHFAGNRGRDRLKADAPGCRSVIGLVFFNSDLFIQRILQFFTLLQSQNPGLEDNLVAAGNLLSLNLGISRYILNNRLDLVIDFFNRIIFSEGNVGRRTAPKFHAQVQRTLPGRFVDHHGARSNQDRTDGDNEPDFPLLNKRNGFAFRSSSVVFLILHAQRIKCVDNQSGNNQRCEHGKDNTKHQCLGEAFYGTGCHGVQNDGGNQSCNVSVKDGGQRLLKSGIDGRFHRISGGDFLTDTGVNDDIRIYRHTDGKDNTGNTGQRQRHVKGIQRRQLKTGIQNQCNSCNNARNLINNDHQNDNKRKSDDTADQGGGKCLLAKLCSYNV